jgi:hypothetical protein
VVAIKSLESGTAPAQAFRIVHMLHQQMPMSAANPWPIQFTGSGNLVVISYNGGGDAINSISSTPSNTWSSTGSIVTQGSNGSQIYYAANAATANAMTLLATRSGTAQDATFMMYDIVGAATSPFDKDSGGQSGLQNSSVSALTTCTGCIAPTSSNELLIANFAQDFCTAVGVNTPNGGLFDPATDTGNSISGPQSVDQNNGWMHFYDSGTSAVTITWSESCAGAVESNWAGRVAAFRGAP